MQGEQDVPSAAMCPAPGFRGELIQVEALEFLERARDVRGAERSLCV